MLNERRKSIVVPVVLLLGIFIGGVVVLRTQGIGAQVLTEGKKVLFPIASEPDADPDSDGLKNWQEEVYKTDPRNPDTDSDGYLDGEEVASGYDPTIAAPNDALEGTDTNTPRQAPKNLTAYLAQILAQKISSGEIDPSSLNTIDAQNDSTIPYNQEVINEALAQIGLRAKEYFEIPHLTSQNIGTQNTIATTAASTIVYLSQIDAIFKAHIDEIKKLRVGEIEMLQKTIDSKDVSAVSVYALEYQGVITDMRAIDAPPHILAWHNDMLATLSVFVKIFKSLEDFQNDPAMAAAALESYIPVIEQLEALGEKMFSYAVAQ